jgi:opacity protein-like surface antigen
MLAAALLVTVSAAQAADMPDLPVLRGSLADGLSTSSHNWDGYYVGGQVGYTTGQMDFSHAPKSLTNFMLRNSVLEDPVSQWSLLPKNHVQANGFGAFVGRNWQWYDAVLGVEANYNYMNNLASSASDTMALLIVNPSGETPPAGHTYTYNTTLTGSAALQIKDLVTLRGRVGWAGGDFMPYMFGGLAVARADVSRSATVSYIKQDDYDVTSTTLIGFNGATPVYVTNTVHHTDTSAPVSQTQAERRTNAFVSGWTGGLGVEWCAWEGLFLRAEWEHIGLSNVKDISVSLDNFRLGAGYKF